MIHLWVPSLSVEDIMLELNTPALYRSILTFSAILSSHVIICELLVSNVSPPLGEEWSNNSKV